MQGANFVFAQSFRHAPSPFRTSTHSRLASCPALRIDTIGKGCRRLDRSYQVRYSPCCNPHTTGRSGGGGLVYLRVESRCSPLVRRRAPIFHLLRPRSPAAICRFVISVVVYAVETQPLWALSHVSKKVLKAFPSLANRYPASPVVPIGLLVGIGAASPHASPCDVLARTAPSAALSVGKPCRSGGVLEFYLLRQQAPATAGSGGRQPRRGD
jgi:hypothetical protein